MDDVHNPSVVPRGFGGPARGSVLAGPPRPAVQSTRSARDRELEDHAKRRAQLAQIESVRRPPAVRTVPLQRRDEAPAGQHENQRLAPGITDTEALRSAALLTPGLDLFDDNYEWGRDQLAGTRICHHNDCSGGTMMLPRTIVDDQIAVDPPFRWKCTDCTRTWVQWDPITSTVTRDPYDEQNLTIRMFKATAGEVVSPPRVGIWARDQQLWSVDHTLALAMRRLLVQEAGPQWAPRITEYMLACFVTRWVGRHCHHLVKTSLVHRFEDHDKGTERERHSGGVESRKPSGTDQ